jgi:hypothetical protein
VYIEGSPPAEEPQGVMTGFYLFPYLCVLLRFGNTLESALPQENSLVQEPPLQHNPFASKYISAKSWVKQTLSIGSQIQVLSAVHAPISFKVLTWSLLRQNTVGRILATTSNLLAQTCLSLRATFHEHCQWEYPPLKQTTTKGARCGSFEFFIYYI